jgi:hypothetical protein
LKIHLTTVAGAFVEVLPHMLEHYRAQGVESFLVNAHASDTNDPALDRIRQITNEFGCGIHSITRAPWRQEVNPSIYERSRAAFPNDWFILADQDELQLYPGDMRAILEQCDAKGYDYLEGGFIDRIASDGGFAPVLHDRSIWEQFPLGGYISTPILDANPNKIVAAKGRVKVVPGQHAALSGRGCPVEECYVEVHHFKWVAGIVERLKHRAAFYKEQNDPLWQESANFLDYVRARHGRLDVTDALFHIAPCSPRHPSWDIVKRLCWSTARARRWSLPLRGAASNG